MFIFVCLICQQSSLVHIGRTNLHINYLLKTTNIEKTYFIYLSLLKQQIYRNKKVTLRLK